MVGKSPIEVIFDELGELQFLRNFKLSDLFAENQQKSFADHDFDEI